MIRPATLADAETLWQLANQHELRVDESFEAYPLSEIQEQIKGFVEPGHPFLLEENGEVVACTFIHSYSSRRRIEIDLFTIGTKEQATELFQHSVAWAAENFQGYEIRTACNKLDVELLAMFEQSGMSFYRDYFKLIRADISLEPLELPAGVEITKASLIEAAEILHRLETDSFSGHFGYVPITLEDWSRERGADNMADTEGNFVLWVEGEPAGFLLSSNSRADVQGGWVDKLGVLERFRGRGFGKLLLQTAINHSAQKGFTSIGLGADTGNDSGALELYFKMGFEAKLSWRAYHLPLLS